MSNNLTQKIESVIVSGFIFFILHASLNYWLLNKDLSTALTSGAIFGVVIGFLNTFFLNRFGVSKNKLESISIDLDNDEKILFQSVANFITHPVALNGQFFITNKSIVFKQHQSANEGELLKIGLQEIEKIVILKLLLIFDSGVEIHTHTKHHYRFTIDKMKALKSFFRHSDELSICLSAS